jgi:AcrR family transcriptional regulator
MPRIWTDTIDSHRRQVHDAILDATAELILEHGPMSVAMSAIAERAGIGRATLYKYFPDVESILLAWHARDFGDHLTHLVTLAESTSVTLDDVTAFVRAQRERHHRDGATGIVGTLAHALAGNGGAMPDAVEREIIDALSALMRQLARRREVRTDLAAEDLARWLFHAIHAPDLDTDAVVELLADSLAPKTGRRPAATGRSAADRGH